MRDFQFYRRGLDAWRVKNKKERALITRTGSPKLATRNSLLATRYFFLPLTFAPIRNNFLTVPVGSRFI